MPATCKPWLAILAAIPQVIRLEAILKPGSLVDRFVALVAPGRVDIYSQLLIHHSTTSKTTNKATRPTIRPPTATRPLSHSPLERPHGLFPQGQSLGRDRGTRRTSNGVGCSSRRPGGHTTPRYIHASPGCPNGPHNLPPTTGKRALAR